MNFEMLLSRAPQDHVVAEAELIKLIGRIKEVVPSLANRREEVLKEQQRLVDEGDNDYFFTSDWEIDLGVFLDTGKLPSNFTDLEFYARLLLYSQIMRLLLIRRYQAIEDKVVAHFDNYFFHVKDLAEQGDEEARKIYEELKKLRPGGDKP